MPSDKPIRRSDALAPTQHALPPVPPDRFIGRTLGGFDVLQKLGQGGMGSVYRAQQRSLGREVALKVLDPELASRPELAERFHREARAAARMDHPHVVQPIDFGDDHGTIFFAMELMEGGSAAGRLAKEGPFPEKLALEVALACGRAFAYAKTLGIVHRDVKPDNILFSKHGVPKLGDLGLVFDRALPGVTELGIAMGTPHYMSPEQAMGARDLDWRSDVYSLGITLWELLSGRRPFEGETPTDVLTQHVQVEVPDVRDVNSSIGAETALLIRKMVSKKRESRFESPDELVRVVRGVLHASAGPNAGDTSAALPRLEGEIPVGAGAVTTPLGAHGPSRTPERASTRPSSHPPTHRSEPTLVQPVEEVAPRAASRRAAILVLGGLLIALACGLGYMVLRQRAPVVTEASLSDTASQLKVLLLSRRAADGGFSWAFDVKSDPWTTSQAFCAFTLSPEQTQPEDYEHMLGRIHSTALHPESDEAAGWPLNTQAGDDAPYVISSSWAGMALAMAGDRYGPVPVKDAARARKFLLGAQLPSGSFPLVPQAGALGARTSSTGVALIALIALDAARAESKGPSPEVKDAVEKAALWLGQTYDQQRHAWFPNPALAWGNRKPVEGLSEFIAWTLLEADTYLYSARAALPGEAEAALVDFAQARSGADLPLETIGASPVEDYVIELPRTVHATITPTRWIYGAWRIAVCERIAARAPALPRAAEWAAEGRRLLGHVAELPRSLNEGPTFQIAESLIVVGLLARKPLDDPHRASLYYFIAGK